MANIILAAYAISTSLALVLLKLGSESGAIVNVVNSKLDFNLSLLNLGGVFFYGLSFIVYTYLIAKYNLGYIVPLATGLVYILVFTASYFIFKENFTVLKVVAIAMIIGGVVLLNTGAATTKTNIKTANITHSEYER